MSNDDRASSKIPKLVIPKVILKGHANEEIPSGTKLLPSDHSNRLPQPLHSTDVDSLQVFQLFTSVLGRLHADLETFVDIASNIGVVDKKRDTLQILLSQGEQLGRLDSVCAWIPWLGEAFTAVSCNSALKEAQGRSLSTLQSLMAGLYVLRNLSIPKLAISSAVGICSGAPAHAAIPLGRLLGGPRIAITGKDCKSAAALFVGLLKCSAMYAVTPLDGAGILVTLDPKTSVEFRLYPNAAGLSRWFLTNVIIPDAQLGKALLASLSRQWLVLGNNDLRWLDRAISACRLEHFKSRLQEAISPLLSILRVPLVLEFSGHELQVSPRGDTIYHLITIPLNSPISLGELDVILLQQEPAIAAMHSILFIYRQMQSQALQVVEGLVSELLQQRALPLDARPCCTMSDASLDYRLGAFSLGLAIEPSGILVRGIEVFCVSLEQSRDEIYRSLRAVLCDFVHSSVLKIMRSLFSDVCLSDFAPLSQVSRHAFLLSIGDQTGCYLLLDLSTLHQGVCDLSLLTATVAKSSGVTERVHKLLAIPLDDLFMTDGLTLEASILNRVDRLVCATQLEHEGFILFVEEERLCLINAPVIFPAVECWLEFRDTLYQLVLYLHTGERIERPLRDLHDVQSALFVALAELEDGRTPIASPLIGTHTR